jgi:SAM-dependent methyltransferase
MLPRRAYAPTLAARKQMPDLANIYDAQFYAGHADMSYESATVVVPHIMKLFAPVSVVDVGCGIGTWLRAFVDAGLTQVLGVDGPHVETASLRIAPEQFRPHDLRAPLPDLGRFDLAVSVEVAEHLPAASAAGFVADLTRLAAVVVFSAAVPGQGGADHVNEQWPEYWEALFQAHGYVQLDPLRPLVWHAPRVQWWYRQNLFVYVASKYLEENDELKALPRAVGDERMTLVSRRILRQYVGDENQIGLRQIVRILPRAILRSFGKGLRRLRGGP